MPACVRCAHGVSKSEIFRFFNSGYAHDRNISRRASTVSGNTLMKPNYASVRQSSDSLLSYTVRSPT